MKKISCFLIIIFTIHAFQAQVGINTTDPKTILDVNGAITNRQVNFSVVNNSVTINTETSLANIVGIATATSTATSYVPLVNGHRLIVNNATTGGFDVVFSGIAIANGKATEFIYTNNSWKTTSGQAGSKLITNVADFGIFPDNNDYSQLIRTVIENANGAPLFFPAGKYKYDGGAISTSRVNILGVMPVYVNGSLENGTIFLNKLNFTGIHIAVQGLGVQLSVADDGFRATTAMNTGKYCRLKDIVTVGANTTSAFHSFLIEGFDYLNADNIECYDGYMGQVIKVKSGNLSRFRDYNIAKESVFLKSDNVYGNCKNLTLNGVQIENPNAGTSTGIKVNSAGAQFQKLSINNVQMLRVQFGVAIISSGGNGVAINDLNLSNFKVDTSTLKCIYIEANSGFVYKTNISNFDATAVGKSLLETVGNIKFLNVSNLNADITSVTTAAEKEQIITIGAATRATNFLNINITKGYTDDTALAINYANLATENRIQNYNIRLKGNSPESGQSAVAISGTLNTIQPLWNSIENVSYVDVTPQTTGVSVSTIAKSPDANYPNDLFKKGWQLFLKNSSSFDLIIKNNPSGTILNTDNADIILPAQSVMQYVFSGSVWSPTVSYVKNRIASSISGEVELDNIRVAVGTSGNKSIRIRAVSTSFVGSGSSENNYSIADTGSDGAVPITNYWKVQGRNFGVTECYWQNNLDLNQNGDTQEILINDQTNNKSYRISLIIGLNNSNNRLVIERLN